MSAVIIILVSTIISLNHWFSHLAHIGLTWGIFKTTDTCLLVLDSEVIIWDMAGALEFFLKFLEGCKTQESLRTIAPGPLISLLRDQCFTWTGSLVLGRGASVVSH